jgi:hypothetical protein
MIPTPVNADSEVGLDAPIAITGVIAHGREISVTYLGNEFKIVSTIWKVDDQVVPSDGNDLYLTERFIGKTVEAEVTLENKLGRTLSQALTTTVQVFKEPPSGGGSIGFGSEILNAPDCFNPRSSTGAGPRIGWSISISCQPFNTTYGNSVERTYTWFRGNLETKTGQSPQYLISSSDVGKEIYVLYQATWANGATQVEMKKLSQEINPLIEISPFEIAGNSEELIAPSFAFPANSIVTYQWFRNYRLLPGETKSKLQIPPSEDSSRFHLLVTVSANGFSPNAALSKPRTGKSYKPVDFLDAYEIPGYPIQGIENFPISFEKSPTINDEQFNRETSLVSSSLSYWAQFSQVPKLRYLYITPQDIDWAEHYFAAETSWKNKVPGGIRQWMNQNPQGFALTFKTSTETVIVHCLPVQESMLHTQVGPHEVAHAIQFSKTTSENLYISSVQWMVEGLANFYGLATGLHPLDPTGENLNRSLAGHASQFDLGQGHSFGTFQNLTWMETGSFVDSKIVIERHGNVFDWYYLGSLISEWLVLNYSHESLQEWQATLISQNQNNSTLNSELNKATFRRIFGFEWENLALELTPYLADRAGQLKKNWTSYQANLNAVSDAVPPFRNKITKLSSIQKNWIKNQLNKLNHSRIRCTYSGETNKQKQLGKSRAKAACKYVSTNLQMRNVKINPEIAFDSDFKPDKRNRIFLEFLN